MILLIMYTLLVAPLILFGRYNCKQAYKTFSAIENPALLKNEQLTDADFLEFVATESEGKPSLLRSAAKDLQRKLFIARMLAGLHGFLVSAITINLWFHNQYKFLICITVFMIGYGIGNKIFAPKLSLKKYLSYSYGHSVPGKSFFAGNPITGYKYFKFSPQLDKMFGLFRHPK